VINKVRALGSYYTKGLDNGSHLRTAINTSESLARLREAIDEFFELSPLPSTEVPA
jgi:tRNA-dihydrouridine synthase